VIIDSRAFARAGLLGNPSDGYYGKTISISVRNFGSRVSLYHTPQLHIEPQKQDVNTFHNIYDLYESIQLHGYYGGDRLIKASIKKFCEYCHEHNCRLENKNFTVQYQSTIPRQVGLAGSSAIITATMKALMRFYDISIPREYLPTLVLMTEVGELGINAGLQDRVIQVYEGCVYMDFEKRHMKSRGYGKYQPLDPALLPKLYIAYRLDLGKVSGQVLNDIRTRYNAGDREVVATLGRIADIAEEGKKAMEEGDHETLARLIDENFDLRSTIMNISDENMNMIRTARSCGASAKFAGSGGSIIGMYRDDEMLNHLIVEMKKIGARVIKPYVI
jgi:glucuronokinase